MQNNVKLGEVRGLGATNRVKVGLFDTENKAYNSKELTGDFEIAPLYGNISTMNGELYFHFHINVGDKNYNSFGGHLNYAYVSATFEGFIDIIDGEVDRKFDENIGLNTFDF